MPSVGLAGVFDTFGAAYLASHALPRGAAKVWRAIVACRTPALGGHVESCDRCGSSRHVYHSCRNRHCPRCQTRAKEAWLAARRREVLPVPYFHLVFTLPHGLNGLVAAAPRALYETLFATVSATLTEFAASPRHLGGVPAFSLVLHTWQQDLGRHVHAHALVAGGALSAAGEWLRPRRGFLFPVRALSRVFRGKFMAGLDGLQEQGRLPGFIAANPDWQTLKRGLYAHDWVVYAKAPLGGPEAVLEYLGRYTHRVAISNERIVGVDAHEVRFRVRAQASGHARRTLALPPATFIDRFLLHVLPKGFKRIRHYGILGPAGKAVKLAQARAALSIPPPDPVVVESVAAFMRRIDRVEWARCTHCGQGAFLPTATIAPTTTHVAFSRGPP